MALRDEPSIPTTNSTNLWRESMQSLEERKAKHREVMRKWREKNRDYWKKYNADVKSGARVRQKRGQPVPSIDAPAPAVDVPSAF